VEEGKNGERSEERKGEYVEVQILLLDNSVLLLCQKTAVVYVCFLSPSSLQSMCQLKRVLAWRKEKGEICERGKLWKRWEMGGRVGGGRSRWGKKK